MILICLSVSFSSFSSFFLLFLLFLFFLFFLFFLLFFLFYYYILVIFFYFLLFFYFINSWLFGIILIKGTFTVDVNFQWFCVFLQKSYCPLFKKFTKLGFFIFGLINSNIKLWVKIMEAEFIYYLFSVLHIFFIIILNYILA